MEKDFDRWSLEKKRLDQNRRDLFFKEGQVWWCSVGLNIGEEVYGKGYNFRRPVMILKKLSKNLCIVIPLTTRQKGGDWYFAIDACNIEASVMLHQIRLISTNRLSKRMYDLPENDHINIKRALAKLLELF